MPFGPTTQSDLDRFAAIYESRLLHQALIDIKQYLIESRDSPAQQKQHILSLIDEAAAARQEAKALFAREREEKAAHLKAQASLATAYGSLSRKVPADPRFEHFVRAALKGSPISPTIAAPADRGREMQSGWFF